MSSGSSCNNSCHLILGRGAFFRIRQSLASSLIEQVLLLLVYIFPPSDLFSSSDIFTLCYSFINQLSARGVQIQSKTIIFHPKSDPTIRRHHNVHPPALSMQELQRRIQKGVQRPLCDLLHKGLRRGHVQHTRRQELTLQHLRKRCG